MKFGPPPKEASHLSQLGQNATEYFNTKFQGSTCLHRTQWATFPDGEVLYFLCKLYYNGKEGVKIRVIIIDDLGKNPRSLHAIAQYKFDIPLSMWQRGEVPSDSMPMAPRIFIYTNKAFKSTDEVQKIFSTYQPNSYIEVIDESMIHKSLFISYGNPDEEIAKKINDSIKAKGVNTWFFPDDSIPGEKLHRMMSDNIHKHDRTLLICSKDSISRFGVLNEIERLLERESSEGGSEIIIPVALDSYIFDEWSPERDDIRRQILSRVVCKINEDNFDNEIQKIIKALQV